MKKAPKLPKFIRTLAGIANLIREHFKMPCDRMKIKNWQTRHTPPFPFPGENNEFNVKECFAWVKALQKRKGESKGEGAVVESQLELLERKSEVARLNSKIIIEEERQFEFDKKRGKFVDRELANQTFMAAVCEYHTIVKRNVQALCDEELAKKIIGGIETDCARLASENV